MTKVIYVPLDERPCNYFYPQSLAAMTDIEMITPDRDILGDMKVPADVPALLKWLEKEAETADYVIVSIDMLIYGGIVPSRLHSLSEQECLNRLHILKTIKGKNPNLCIYAFNLIMRVPAYNSSEEEPDYYEQFGERIFRLGWLTDKKEKEVLNEVELEEFSKIEKELPKNIKEDYFGRRNKNFSVTKHVLQLVNSDIIDYLIIPLDDNSKYGFTAREQRQLMYIIDQYNVMDKVNIYPGADEIACTLFSRVFCSTHKYTPEIFVRYSSTKGPFIIPRYEDRSLSESIKSHITSAGGVIVQDETHNHAVLMVHSPPVGQKDMAESSFPLEQRHRAYFSEMNTREFVQAIKYYIQKGQHVALADVAVSNGGDHYLLQLLSKQNILGQLIAYAGWNTNGNTMGTVVAHAIIASYYEQNSVTPAPSFHHESRKFYYSRLVEDWGYQSVVRKHVSYEVLPTLGLTPRNLGEKIPEITKLVKELLEQFVHQQLSALPEGELQLHDVYLPWRRMFEVGFHIKMVEKVEQDA